MCLEKNNEEDFAKLFKKGMDYAKKASNEKSKPKIKMLRCYYDNINRK